MRTFDVMLFLALLGAVSGALQYVMLDTAGDNWFPGYSGEDMTTVEMENAEQWDNAYSNVEDSEGMGLFSALGIIWSSAKGILYFEGVLDDVFYFEDPENPTTNLFAPILHLIQAGIYLVYGFGIFQLITGRQAKGME